MNTATPTRLRSLDEAVGARLEDISRIRRNEEIERERERTEIERRRRRVVENVRQHLADTYQMEIEPAKLDASVGIATGVHMYQVRMVLIAGPSGGDTRVDAVVESSSIGDEDDLNDRGPTWYAFRTYHPRSCTDDGCEGCADRGFCETLDFVEAVTFAITGRR